MPLPDDSSNWSDKRRQLLEWFRQKTPSLAGAYEGAVKMLNDASFPGRTHFICHALRDISDRLIFALDPEQKGDRVQYENAFDEIEKSWPTIELIDHNGTPIPSVTITLDDQLARRIDSLVGDHRKRRKRPSNQDLLLRHLMRNEPTQVDRNERVAGDFKKLREWFVAKTHLRDKPDEVDENELQRKFSAFEDMLYSFVGDFFGGKAEVDEILREAKERNSTVTLDEDFGKDLEETIASHQTPWIPPSWD